MSMLTSLPAEHVAPSGMPPELVLHFMDLLWCVVPKIDDIIWDMPSVIKHINSYKLCATARYVAGGAYQEVAQSMHRFDPVTATHLLLLEHVIPDKSWRELAKAMHKVGLDRTPIYQHVEAVASGCGAPRSGKRKAEEELPTPKSQRGDMESIDDGE